MKPVLQRFRTVNEAENIAGDCYRACVASIMELDLEEVPNFNEGFPDGDTFHRRVSEWLAPRGFGKAMFAIGDDLDLPGLLEFMADWSPNCYYILGGTSPRGFDHAVVGLNDKIVHCPNENDPPLVGVLGAGHWEVSVLTPFIKDDG